jgi:hypothetical protein
MHALMRREPENKKGTILYPLLAAAAGAALMYLLDPDRGRRRRAVARDKLTSRVRRTRRGARRLSRRTSAEAYGLRQKATHLRREDGPSPDDVTMVRIVESELFRDPNVPKGQMNIDAHGGVVTLRGEVERPDQIKTIEAAVRKAHGVRAVENLLHLKGTPAPNKAAARQATATEAAYGSTGNLAQQHQ